MLKIPARFKQCDLSVSLAFDYCDCIVNMGTRAAAFTAKIRNLYDYQLRLMQGILPLPSGVDIANTIKYFSQTLLSVLKDVKNSPFDLLKDTEMDGVRMGLFPSLDYKGLYNSIIPLIEVAPLITNGLHAFGQALLQCLGCLLPFLEHDLIDNLPYLTASTIAVLPPSLHQEIINTLCYYILPFTITRHDPKQPDICQSVSSVIMMIFQYSTNPAHHCQLLECLMTLKQNILKDMLSAIAYGTSNSRASAAKLLFYYWPTFNANLFDRKNLICKFADPTPFVCQRNKCPNSGNAEAAKVCYDHCIAIKFSTDIPPPLYLCIECANEIHREHPNQSFFDVLHPMQQVSMVCENKNCRSTDKSAISICFGTECASYNGNHPIRYCEQCHNNRHNSRRGGDHIVHKAIPPTWEMDPEMQTCMVEAIVSLLTEARIPEDELKDIDRRDLDEKSDKKESKECKDKEGKSPIPALDNISVEERQLLGRYGVWLLVGRCSPDDNTQIEVLGRLLAMIFHWFHMTAYSYDGREESALEKLKTVDVCGWLKEISKSHYNLFVSCLLPHPPDYARIGGHWDTLATKTTHLKEGLDRLFCLVPYDVITQEIWDFIMPHWMEATVDGVPEKELPELKIVLSKILDADMSPLGFDSKKMYHFVAIRFQQTSAKVQQQALKWLQTLTLLEISTPLHLLFSIFGDGVTSMKEGANHGDTVPIEQPQELQLVNAENKRDSLTTEETQCDDSAKNSIEKPPELQPANAENKMDSLTKEDNKCDDSAKTSTLEEANGINMPQSEKKPESENNLSCCILMLDILLKQMELQEIDKHTGLNSSLCKNVCSLLKSMITAAWISSHACSTQTECTYCECSIMWHQLAYELVIYLSPVTLAHPPDPPCDSDSDDVHSRKSPPESDKKEKSSEVVLNMPIPEVHSVGGALVHMPHVCSVRILQHNSNQGQHHLKSLPYWVQLSPILIMTATVETVSEQLDIASIIPAEKAVSAVTRAITLSDTDIAKSQGSVTGENNEQADTDSDDIDFWQTSVGKFRFSIDELPEPIQYIHQVLIEISKVSKPDILYYMLKCLNVLILYGDACTKASKENKGFFIWCQEHLIIKNIWNLLNSDHSHICQEAVPLLLHCITLSAGLDVFWRIIQEDFHNQDWRVRFRAVERVTVLARFMADCPLRNQMQLQAALANAFCYLISSMDDPNVYVAQRATLYLGTIHDFAIRSLIMCLETQFDAVILDRPMVLQSIYQLHNSLSERKILNWDFFLNRFDTLFIEAQIALEKAGDISYVRDLKNTDVNSETFIRKLHRAHDALSGLNEGSIASSVKTLSASFGTKWPYKRTMSAPASIIRHQESKSVYVPETKEKVYSRQYSAPILKRKSSRFGLGQFLGTSNSIPDGHMHSLNVVDDHNLTTFLQKIIDLEEADKETIHLLIFLLMQFLSRSDQAYPAEEKNLARTQTIVLKHLWLLLGYSQTDRGIYLPPQSLRASPAFNVFLVNLPQLMDQNHLMGRILLPTCLIILQYAPSPYYIPSAMDFQQPLYSLWALEPHTRKHWLMSLVVLLYKYQYNQQPHCMQLTALIRIVLNTLDSQHHHCRRIPATIIMGQQPSRSRDVSQPSLGTEIDHPERTTPPLSPMYSSDGQSIQVSLSSKGGKVQVSYTKPSSITSMETYWEETNQNENYPDKRWEKSFKKQLTDKISLDDDTESELKAIPESDISDSTLQGSVQDSFEEALSDNSGPGISKQLTEKALVNRSPKESVSSLIEMKKICSNKSRPVWIIGSEEDSIRSCDNKMQDIAKAKMDFNKNCARTKSTSSSASVNLTNGSFSCSSVHTGKSVAALPHRQLNAFNAVHVSKSTPMGRHKKVIEPSITPVCTPVLDCDSNRNNLPTPAMERLLPIGPIKSPELDEVFSPLEPQLQIPTQERLLPIGSHTKDISQLVEKVKQALNINTQLGKITRKNEQSEKKSEQPSTSQTHSPRKLIKQVALESPPNLYESDDNGNGFENYLKSIKVDSTRDAIVNHRQRIRKPGTFNTNSHQQKPKIPGAWLLNSQLASPKTETTFDTKQSSFRIGEECVKERCSECGTVRETYSDEEMGLCIVALGTFIHREPSLAAPLLPDILSIVAKIATNASYPWQCESSIHLPGGAVSVAHQFLRCVLHQLAPNGIFMQMFQTKASEHIRLQFFKSVIQALVDFNELNPIAPLQLLLENLNSKKTLPVDLMPTILSNMASYLNCLPLEAAIGPTTPMWSTVLQQLEILYRKLLFLLNALDDVAPLLNIMASVFKMPLITQFKGILEPFSKVLSYAIQTHTLKYNLLVEICYLCNKAFTKDRDKLIFSRMVVFELVQVLKFKTTIPDSNLLMLINLVLQDVGGHIPSNVVIKDSILFSFDYSPACNTGISECMKLNLVDILEFLSDFHTISKMKSYCKGIGVGLNDDTLGGIIKCSVAQYLALEITKGNGRDNRAVTRYFPWLYSTSASQQSPREFVECIGHIRLLSWLLLGSLTHTALQGRNSIAMLSQPIPHEASCQIADNIQVIMSGFAEQPKASVLHMSSLFHAFILCQLWTVYLEQSLNHHIPITEAYNVTMNILFDFWSKVTPCILQLVQHSKTLSEIVSLHFLSMLEALIECQSTFVAKLLPLWTPVLLSSQVQLPGHLQVRLQNCRNFPPTIYQEISNEKTKLSHLNNPMLLKWLQRLQFKMGQIELQSSTATQFYSL
ncbi:protein unc-79 homolog [Sitophilus oryzae]|uniref:Protein unc-79 homolog n=1 Tax=Sitophilus oryzae TaxID=7048 RepID=A0A6J2XXY2_SITOR|nr:protein unc-79 homolog [Sitophilus oryzae]